MMKWISTILKNMTERSLMDCALKVFGMLAQQNLQVKASDRH